MEISLAMLLELLQLPHDNLIHPENQVKFRGVRLLLCPESCLPADTLYITTQALAEELLASGKTFCCLCILGEDSKEPCQSYLNHMVIIKENISLDALYQRAKSCFQELKNWNFNLYSALLNQEGLQQLLAHSKGILKNHLHIVEPFSRLLAYTKDIDFDELDINNFYAQNLHKPDTYPELKEQLLADASLSSNGIYLFNNSLFMNPTITKALTFHDSYTLYVVMICKHRPLSDGIQELFLHLCKYIQLFGENRFSSYEPSSFHETFINGILDGALSKYAIDIHATLTLKLPIKSNFNLYKIILPEEYNDNYQKIMMEISAALPAAKLSNFQNSIVVLNQYEKSAFTKIHHSNLKAIHKILNKYQALCGISNQFYALYKMLPAYQQAGIVLNTYSKKVETAAFSFMANYSESPFFQFDTFSLAHLFDLVSEQDKNSFLLSPYMESITAIKDYDQQHSSSCLETLYVYLTHERNLASTSEYLHISREMVAHSIHNIAHLIYGDLDSWQVRVKLLLAFEHLNLHPEDL